MEKDVVIRVKLNGLDSCSDDSLQIYRNIVKINEEFTSICNNLDWDIQSAAGIRTSANKLTSSIKDDEQSLANLRVYLRKADEIYRELDGIEVELKDLDEKLISTSEPSNVFKDFLETFNQSADIVDLVYGFFSKIIKDIDLGELGIAGPVVETILNLFLKATSNYEEYLVNNGEMSVSRAVAETVLETATDFAIDQIVGLPGYIPKVIVFAAWTEIYGENFTEEISDFILDTFEDIYTKTSENMLEIIENISDSGMDFGFYLEYANTQYIESLEVIFGNSMEFIKEKFSVYLEYEKSETTATGGIICPMWDLVMDLPSMIRDIKTITSQVKWYPL